MSFFGNLITEINRRHCKRMGIETTAYDVPLSPAEASGRLSDDELMRIQRGHRRDALMAAEDFMAANPACNSVGVGGLYLDRSGNVSSPAKECA